MTRTSLRVFFVLALAVAVGLAVAVSPYASTSPDGLTKVSEQKGFAASGTVHVIQEDSPIPGYAFPGIDDARVAKGLAGFVGTLAVALLAMAIGWAVHRRTPASRRGDPAAA
jgi:hypothetical protein